MDQSINQCYICSIEIHREFMPAIHRKSLIWLIMTFSTSPSKTTIQIAIDSNLDTRIYLDGINDLPWHGEGQHCNLKRTKATVGLCWASVWGV
jgi:hypothetical protein